MPGSDNSGILLFCEPSLGELSQYHWSVGALVSASQYLAYDSPPCPLALVVGLLSTAVPPLSANTISRVYLFVVKLLFDKEVITKYSPELILLPLGNVYIISGFSAFASFTRFHPLKSTEAPVGLYNSIHDTE